MKRNIIICLILILGLAGGGAIACYYSYEDTNYIITDNAQITANLVTIYPEVQGKIMTWNVKEGDDVKSGQVLGNQDTEASIKSSAMNSQVLNTDVDSLIAKTEIKSPIDGKVIQTSVTTGQMASSGSGVAIIADTSNIYVNANIKETDIFNVKHGQKVEINIDAYPNKIFTGYVDNIIQAGQSVFSIIPSQNSSGNYTKVTELIPVKINIINNYNLSLMPGMNATVKIHIKEK